jgi:hypothetical protein
MIRGAMSRKLSNLNFFLCSSEIYPRGKGNRQADGRSEHRQGAVPCLLLLQMDDSPHFRVPNLHRLEDTRASEVKGPVANLPFARVLAARFGGRETGCSPT